MILWRKEAFERFPEFRKELQEEKSPYGFLSFLYEKLEEAYRGKDYEKIEKIRKYVLRLTQAKRGHDSSSDLATIVMVGFFENLPRSELIRKDIGRWFSTKEIEEMKATFTYHGSEEDYMEMIKASKTFKIRKVQQVAAPNVATRRR